VPNLEIGPRSSVGTLLEVTTTVLQWYLHVIVSPAVSQYGGIRVTLKKCSDIIEIMPCVCSYTKPLDQQNSAGAEL
jgi:hypothetical protein